MCQLYHAATPTGARTSHAIHRIMESEEERLWEVIGPCSVHDPEAALEYAGRLLEQRRRLAGELEVVMRVYFEKPRTTVGWKGLINDPDLAGSCSIERGLPPAGRRVTHSVVAGKSGSRTGDSGGSRII